MKGDSERVPGKNMRPLCGRPLFYWIMDALNDSGVVSEIIINTDSEEIATSAREYFDVTIHMRPDYLLDIQSNEPNQIMEHDLKQTDGEFFIQSHSTNPLVKGISIKAAVDTFYKNLDQYDSLLSVTPLQTRLYNEHFQAMNHDPDKLIKTQELPFVYEENSCIYVFSRTSFTKNRNRIGAKPYLFPISRYEAVDIDEEYDFLLADTMMCERVNKTE